MITLVFDAGMLIALERRRKRALAIVEQLVAARIPAHVPAGVVAQVWRGSPRQHAVVRLLKAEAVRVHALDEAMAYRVGLLLATTGSHDVVDAHVALLARSLRCPVVTSDPEDLRRLDGALELVVI